MRDKDGNLLVKEHEQWVGYDDQDPAELAMQREEGDTDAQAICGMPRDGLATILRFVLPPTLTGVRKWRVAQMRYIALAHLCGVRGVAELSQTQIAKELGVTRALVSHYFTSIADRLAQAQTRHGRSKAAREVYGERARRVWARRANTAADTDNIGDPPV